MQVQTEVPGSPIFIMKCVENARHIEVQLIADRLVVAHLSLLSLKFLFNIDAIHK